MFIVKKNKLFYCVTVSYGQVRGSAKQWPYHQPALYYVQLRKSDGKPVWKYVCHLGRARRSFRLAIQDAEEYAKENKIEYIEGIRNNCEYEKI